MLQPQPSPATHEAAFIERYERLRKSALILTKQNQEQAEDLLHDAFVQFLLSHPDLQSIQNLDGYLYRVLRNMRVSQMRRAARLQEATLTIAGSSLENILSLPDHSSLESGLNSIEQRAQQQVQDELRRICQYAVARKASSKAGSIVMLRFFLGYYPEEIAQIFKSPRATIDKALQRARGEIRLYLAEPDSLSFIQGDAKSQTIGEVEPGETLAEFLQNLRAAVYSAEPGPCLSIKTIREWYSSKSAPSGPDTKALSHAVSCRKCVDEMNRTLDLPLLATRHPAAMGRRDSRKPRKGGKGGGASGGASGGGVRESFLDKSRKRLKQAFDHRPQELRICVNGFLLGSQRINAELNEQTLSIKGEDKVGFVEIFSEREVRLLFYCVESPPDGPVEHHQRVELSAGRSLELSLDFSAQSPNIEVLYRDPTLAAAEIAEVEHVDSAYSAREEAAEPKRSPLIDLKLRSASIARRFLDWQYWLRPATVTALCALLLLGALTLLYRHPPPPPLTAAGLLQQASAAEDVDLARLDQVLHRTISLEEKRVGQAVSLSGGADLIAKRKIEIWQSAERGVLARRLYDERDNLIAGDWRRRDGVRTLYHHGSRPQVQLAPEESDLRRLSFETIWRLDPWASEFSRLIGSLGEARLEEKPGRYVVSFSRAAGANNSGLVHATLVLNSADLHVIEQTLVVEQADDVREFRFIETDFERRSLSSVPAAVFEPERELVSSLLNDNKLRTDGESIAEFPESVSANSAAATADLQVEALNLLNQAGADTGEQIDVKRTGGILRIDGLVDNENRKNELIKALQPIANNPTVRINIMTVAEALKKEESREQTKKGQLSAERFDTSGADVPVRDKLRSYFGTDEAANNFAARMIGRSRSAMSRVGALKRLVGQFTLAELKELSPEARAKWLNLVRSHARAFQQETAALRQDLTPVFGGGSGGAAAPEINDDAALIRAVMRLFELGAANDRVVRASLSISSDRAAADLSPDFFRSLRTTESLAERIQAVK